MHILTLASACTCVHVHIHVCMWYLFLCLWVHVYIISWFCRWKISKRLRRRRWHHRRSRSSSVSKRSTSRRRRRLYWMISVKWSPLSRMPNNVRKHVYIVDAWAIVCVSVIAMELHLDAWEQYGHYMHGYWHTAMMTTLYRPAIWATEMIACHMAFCLSSVIQTREIVLKNWFSSALSHPTRCWSYPLAVKSIKKQQLVEVRSLANPPKAVKMAMESICLLIGDPTTDWRSIRTILIRDNFIPTIINFSTEDITWVGQSYILIPMPLSS